MWSPGASKKLHVQTIKVKMVLKSGGSSQHGQAARSRGSYRDLVGPFSAISASHVLPQSQAPGDSAPEKRDVAAWKVLLATEENVEHGPSPPLALTRTKQILVCPRP